MSELAMPPGDPAAIEAAADAVGRCAVQVGDLAAATHRTMTGVTADSDWTGKAADAYTAWTGGLVKGVGGMERPFAEVPRAVAGYAAALRAAQARVTAYNTYQRQTAAFAGPVTPAASAKMQTDLRGLLTDAENAIADLEHAADAAGRALNTIAETLNHVFDSSGPFHAWLETVMRPWDATAADAILEVLKNKGEGGVKAFEAAADWQKEGLPKALAQTMNDMLKDPLTQAASCADLADAAASGDLQELDAVLARWQNLRGAAQVFSDQWANEPMSLLGKMLPALKGLGVLTDSAGVIGGVYTMVSPPEYDHGTLRAVDRAAGFGAAAGGATGLAVTAGVDFGSMAVLGTSLAFVPVVGEVVGVGAGLYLTADWAYHNTHWISHTFDSARHTVAHYADDMGHAVSSGFKDVTSWL